MTHGHQVVESIQLAPAGLRCRPGFRGPSTPRACPTQPACWALPFPTQQVLQTLSILIQNLRNQQTVYYLFSNNHINEIVSMRFDFDDDEVLVGASISPCWAEGSSEGHAGCWQQAALPRLRHCRRARFDS